MSKGFCECNCGGITKIATRNSKEKGWIKGQHKRFINRHHARLFRHTVESKKKIGIANSISLKGNVPWNKGKKGIMKAWNKNRTKEEYPQLSNSGVKRGNVPWNYIDGKRRETRHEAMGRIDYILWRTAVFTRDNYQCVLGGKSHGTKIEADHIKPWALYPELRYAIDNGRTLCKDCHKQTGTYGYRRLYR